MENFSGCLFINKPVGLTSRQVGVIASKKLGTRKIGHLGTLDPFAEGLLILMVNSGTKIAPYIEDKVKTYKAYLKLGKKTDSGDLTGNIIEEKDIPSLSIDKINEVLHSFLGKSKQIPPMYSAIKVNGTHLYDMARKGIEIEREPRDIEVFSIELNSYENDELVFTAKVSKGTYIRTLGEDIASRLNTVGHLTRLIRTEIDGYSLKDAINPEEITVDSLKPISEVLNFMPHFKVSGAMEKIALNGGKLFLRYKEKYILIYNDDGPIGVYEFASDGVYSCSRGLR